MQITSVDFVSCAAQPTQFPAQLYPEYAFIGRSNVGKSSLINMLVENKHIAKTSSTPGKTRTINFYLINKKWYLVDMPGYGYAKISQEQRRKINEFVFNYFKTRKSLIYVFLLIDSRHKPLENDIKFIIKLAENQIPFTIVFTKVDKLSKNQLNTNVNLYKTELLKIFEELPHIFITSAVTKEGRMEMLNFIQTQNKLYSSYLIKINKDRLN